MRRSVSPHASQRLSCEGSAKPTADTLQDLRGLMKIATDGLKTIMCAFYHVLFRRVLISFSASHELDYVTFV
jgi:hypothetical protein